MASIAPMVNMPKLLAQHQAAIEAKVEAKAAETQAHVTSKTTETKSHVTTRNNETKSLVSAENDATQETLSEITTVNGQIDTNVQTINTHTTSKKNELAAHVTSESDRVLANLPKQSPIKSIQRGVATATSATNVSIAEVDVNKSVLNVSTSQTDYRRGNCYARLYNSTTLTFNSVGSSGSFYTAWELIEYV